MKHFNLLYISLPVWMIIGIAIVIALNGCATNPTTGAVMPLPSIECKGKGAITGTGNVGIAGNGFSIQADCGESGFSFKQSSGQ